MEIFQWMCGKIRAMTRDRLLVVASSDFVALVSAVVAFAHRQVVSCRVCMEPFGVIVVAEASGLTRRS